MKMQRNHMFREYRVRCCGTSRAPEPPELLMSIQIRLNER